MTTTPPQPTVLDGHLDYARLLDEVQRGLATLLIEEGGPRGQALYRIVVQRADGSVWEARNAYHVAGGGRDAERWLPEEAESLLRLSRQQQRQIDRLKTEVPARTAAAYPTWVSLMFEVGAGDAAVLRTDTLDGVINVVVQRANGAVWEATQPKPGAAPAPAFRWSAWEVEHLLQSDAANMARVLRLEMHVRTAMARARGEAAR